MRHLDEGMIHAWLDGQLPRDEAQAVEAHVAECRPCADAVAEARGLIAASSRILTALDGVPRGVLPQRPAPTNEPDAVPSAPTPVTVETPNDVIDVRSRAAATSPAIQRARRRWLSGPSLAAAATIILAVGTVTIMRNGGADLAKPRASAISAEAGPFADSAMPSVAAATSQQIASPTPESSSARAPGEANERQLSAAAARDRVAASGTRSERDRALNRTEAVSALSPNAAGAVANAPAPPPQAAKRALESESKQVVDEKARLAKEGEARADSVVRRQTFAAVPAAPPAAPAAAEPRAKPDSNTVTIIRGREASPQKFVDSARERDARADVARAPAVQGQSAQAPTAQVAGSQALAATGFVRGRVTDRSGTSVAQAQIAVAGTSIGTLTNEQGEFMLSGVLPGTHGLQIRRLGYRVDTQTVTVVAGQTAVADFVMRPATTSLESVVVTTGTAAAPDRRAAAPSRVATPASSDAPSGAAVSATQSNAVGCYEITVTPNAQQARTGLRNVPRRLALDNEIVPANQDGVWYRARDLARTGAVPNGVWRPVGTDGIELEWTYGSRLARIRLTGPARTSMRGTVDEFDRSAGTGESGSVVSIRRSCDG